MSTLTLSILIIILFFLLILSAFFSSAETAMMSLNRYRLRHQMKEGSSAAARVFFLLKRPDYLLGAVLAGNTFANIVASAIATLIFTHFFSEAVAIIASFILTGVILIFCEVAPKTITSYHALSWAKSISLPLIVLLKVLNPFVVAVTAIANGLLWLVGFRVQEVKSMEALSADELRSVVSETKNRLPAKYLTMLIGILDLQQLSVNDIMVPRDEIYGVDLHADWNAVLKIIGKSEYTRLPVYEGSLEHMVGLLHLRDVAHVLLVGDLTPQVLRSLLREPYFIPEGTSLYDQLLNFQKHKHRSALVVDEYGDVVGLATLEDLLEEIVGDFTTDMSAPKKVAYQQKDGSYLLRGNLNIREVNELMGWSLPTDGPKTLSGLITDHLQAIPQTPVCVRIETYRLTAEKIKKNKIKQVRVNVPL